MSVNEHRAADARGGMERIGGDTARESAWLLAVGAIFVVLGFAAVVFPLVASLATTVFVGWILAAAGIVQLLHALQAAPWRRRTLFFVIGLLGLAIGATLALRPVQGMLSLALLLGIFLLFAGLVRAVVALGLRPHDYWGVLLASGLLAAALGAILLLSWPEAAGWLLGLVVGVDLCVAGAWLLALGAAGRRAAG